MTRRAPYAGFVGGLLALVLTGGGLLGCASTVDRASDGNSLDAPSVPTGSETTTTTLPPPPDYRSWIANVRPELRVITIYDAPAGQPLQLDTAGDGTLTAVAIPNPLPSGAPTTFRVNELAVLNSDAQGTETLWHEVFIPSRPNNSLGWVRDGDVTITHTDMSIAISLSEHTLTLFENGEASVTYPVAAGTPDAPTPTGHFFTKELVQPPSAEGLYGPIAYGLSAFSPTLVDTEAFADGVIGIHGTNRPELIGQDVSHGCLRMTNEDILDLETHKLPLGMPVEIFA